MCFPSFFVIESYICVESCEFSSLTSVDIKSSYYHIPVKRGQKIRWLFFAFYALKRRKKLLVFFQSPDWKPATQLPPTSWGWVAPPTPPWSDHLTLPSWEPASPSVALYLLREGLRQHSEGSVGTVAASLEACPSSSVSAWPGNGTVQMKAVLRSWMTLSNHSKTHGKPRDRQQKKGRGFVC